MKKVLGASEVGRVAVEWKLLSVRASLVLTLTESGCTFQSPCQLQALQQAASLASARATTASIESRKPKALSV